MAGVLDCIDRSAAGAFGVAQCFDLIMVALHALHLAFHD
jgi:hypothetical protein